MSRYLLTRDAEADLKEIRDWYRTERGHEAARRALHDLRATMRRLARNPRIGHPRPDLLPAELLVWPGLLWRAFGHGLWFDLLWRPDGRQ